MRDAYRHKFNAGRSLLFQAKRHFGDTMNFELAEPSCAEVARRIHRSFCVARLRYRFPLSYLLQLDARRPHDSILLPPRQYFPPGICHFSLPRAVLFAGFLMFGNAFTRDAFEVPLDEKYFRAIAPMSLCHFERGLMRIFSPCASTCPLFSYHGRWPSRRLPLKRSGIVDICHDANASTIISSR